MQGTPLLKLKHRSPRLEPEESVHLGERGQESVTLYVI